MRNHASSVQQETDPQPVKPAKHGFRLRNKAHFSASSQAAVEYAVGYGNVDKTGLGFVVPYVQSLVAPDVLRQDFRSDFDFGLLGVGSLSDPMLQRALGVFIADVLNDFVIRSQFRSHLYSPRSGVDHWI